MVFGALSVAPVASAQAPAPAPAAPAKDDQAKERAKVHFQRGIAAYKEGRFKDAIDAFLDAHRQYPSPTLSFNAARAYEKMGDSAGALRFYREYLRQAPDAADKSTVAARISELESKLQQRGLQQVTILSVPEGATVILDDRPVGVTPWTGEIFPGKHRARLRREGYDDKTEEFELSAHRSLDVSVELSKAEAKTVAPGPTPNTTAGTEPRADPGEGKSIGIATWATLGVGVAALGGALVFEILRGQSEDDVKNEETQVARHEAFDTMESRQTTSRVLAGVGGAALIVGGVLLYLDLSGDSKPDDSKVGFGCDGSGCAATFGGHF
jgi:tetratricopeptide (TPR) repeat protein